MDNNNSLTDTAVEIKNGKQLNMYDLNQLVADMILNGLSEQQIKQSATRIAHERFDYELSRMNDLKKDLTKRLSRLNSPVSPLDL